MKSQKLTHQSAGRLIFSLSSCPGAITPLIYFWLRSTDLKYMCVPYALSHLSRASVSVAYISFPGTASEQKQ